MSQLPPPPPPPAYGQGGGYPAAAATPGTNTLAIIALVLSILCCGGLTSVLAIILGFVAKGQIKKTGESGAGMATAAIVIGCVTLLLSIIYYIYWIAVLRNSGVTYYTTY